jgi:SAM-dependent methyltransferase
MKRFSAYLDSSRPSPLARAALSLADTYVQLRHWNLPTPPRKMMYEGVPSSWVYRRNGLAYMDHLKKFAGLTSSSKIYDIGSGLGRKTWPLADFLTEGEYFGIEPREDAVQWCRQSLSAVNSRLQFHHHDAINGYYNIAGSIDSASCTLPGSSGHYDIVMANSVFTHMLPAGVENYLAEMARLVNECGVVFATFFLEPDDPAVCGPILNAPRYTFATQRDGYRVQHADCDEHVVSYPEHRMRQMFGQAGIRVKKLLWGSWRGNRDYLDFQDIVIGCKA